MTEESALQVKELEPEEMEEINKLFEVPQNYIRIGPKGYIMSRKYARMASDIYNLELRPDDITVASYQRSGTTVTQELVWLLANNLDYEKAANISLTRRYQFLEFAMFFDETVHNPVLDDCPQNTKALMEIMQTPVAKILPNLPSPRFIKTHQPMSLLPPKLVDYTKVIYVARDPRDVAISSYHHAKLFRLLNFKRTVTFKQIWNAIIKDLFIQTPYFENVKEAWALRHHPNMLFLFYEEIIKDVPATIRRVAAFLGKELTLAQVDRLHEHLKIDNFKNNKSVNFEELREFGLLQDNETFVRKGTIGSWREVFDEEMCSETERWIADNLRDTDLRFPSMT